MTSKVIEGHIRPFLAKIFVEHSFIDRFWYKFVWILCRKLMIIGIYVNLFSVYKKINNKNTI